MDVQREVEVKLAVPDDFVLPDLVDIPAVGSVEARVLRLRATYWDSTDLRLARGGVTLRHRSGEGPPRWTLKLPVMNAVGRWELSVAGPSTRVPEELHDQVRARLRGDLLGRRASMRTTRTSLLLRDADGAELAEVVDDLVTVTGAHACAWRELEVEQREDPRIVELLVRRLEDAGAQVGSQTGKAYRALGPLSLGPPDVAPLAPVRPKDPAAALVRRRLLEAEHLLQRHDPGVRTGTPDAVHQLRVVCRTLRSDLRTLAPWVDDDRIGQLRGDLQWLGLALGEARDLEVLRQRLRATARDRRRLLDVDPVDAVFAALEVDALAAAREALDADRYIALLQLLHDVAAAPGLSPAAGDRCRDALPPVIDKAWATLHKQSGRLGQIQPDLLWHDTRKAAKRARYAAEAAVVVLGPSPTARRARRAQELLGEHQDAVVAAERVTALALEHPELAYVCGVLAEREHARAEAARLRFLKRRRKLRLG